MTDNELDDSDALEEVDEHTGASALAQEISSLRATLIAAINKRERVPQPLFWNLFADRLRSIREQKVQSRVLSEVLGAALPLPGDDK